MAKLKVKCRTDQWIVLFLGCLFLLSANAQKTTPPLSVGKLGFTDIVAYDIRFSKTYQGIAAPDHQIFAIVDMGYTNRRTDRAFQINLSEFTILTEDSQYVYHTYSISISTNSNLFY